MLAVLLKTLRAKTANTARVTKGLSEQLLQRFASDPLLVKAVSEANTAVDALIEQHGKALFIAYCSRLRASQKHSVCIYNILKEKVMFSKMS